MDLKPLYAADLAAFLISIASSASGHYAIAIPSVVTGLGISSYLVAKVPSKQETEQLNQARIIELETKLNELQTIHTWQQQLLESSEAKKLEEIQVLRESYESRLSADQKALQDLSESKNKEIALLKESEAYKLSELQQQLETEKAELELAFAAKIAQLDADLAATNQWRDNVLKLESDLKKFSEQLKLEEKALRLEEKRIRLDVRDERGQTKELLKNAQLEIQAQNVIIQKLQSEIVSLKEQNEQLFNELYTAKKPDADELVTQIQTALAQQGIQSEFISKRVIEGVERIYLKPTNYWEPSKLEIVAKILPGMVDIPQPTIQAKNGRIEVKIDRRDELDRIKDAPDNWLEILYKDAAKDGKNLAILGARGKGKTEMAKNYCGLVVRNEPDCEVIYIQPKVDDYATFTINGKLFEPDYIGFESVTASNGVTIPSAYDGILYLRKLYSERNSINQQCFADNKPCPKFNRVFFLIDELQLLVSREREFIEPDVIKSEKLRNGQTFVGKIIRDAISLGRSLGITVLALGQLPNVSVYGWNKNDLYQYITIFMSANIPQAASDYAPTKEEKNRILGDLELWRKRASVDSSKDYYCYVRPMDKAGYLALLPFPGAYLD
ncbi:MULTISPECIES: hypothetical protein [Aerosakkonema]|uniref:hypothetical protein n=1 Tax=Aerosakkonema TaxID=1246629 RepID=UPI0035B73558